MSNSISADTEDRETGKFTMTGTCVWMFQLTTCRNAERLAPAIVPSLRRVFIMQQDSVAACRLLIGRGSVVDRSSNGSQWIFRLFRGCYLEDHRERKTGEERRSLGLHRDRDDEHQVHRDWTTKPCMHRRCNADTGPNALHPCM